MLTHRVMAVLRPRNFPMLSFLFLFARRTKIFIRHPRTLFATEDAFQVCKHKLGELEMQLLCNINHPTSTWGWRCTLCLFNSNQDSSQIQGLQGERGICETKRSWCVSKCPKQDNKRRMNISRHLCFWLLFTFHCLNSHQDWELLEGLVGQKGAWKEGMGRKSHQEVSKHSGIHCVSVKYEFNSKHYCCFTSYSQMKPKEISVS